MPFFMLEGYLTPVFEVEPSIPTPVPGQQLCINNGYWLVIKATDNFGMLHILLQKSWS